MENTLKEVLNLLSSDCSPKRRAWLNNYLTMRLGYKEWNAKMKIDHLEFLKEFKETEEHKNLLLELIAAYQKEQSSNGKLYLKLVGSIGKQMADVFYDWLGFKELDKTLHNLKEEFTLMVTKPTITPEMVLRAKAYPMEQLIEVNNRNFALCPFHADGNPSFWVKNNRGHCFSCKKSVDTIQMLIDRDGMSFVNAVKKLSSF